MFIRVGDNTYELVSKEYVGSSNHNVNDNENAFDVEMSSDPDVDITVEALEVFEVDVSAHCVHRIELVNDHNLIATKVDSMFNV